MTSETADQVRHHVRPLHHVVLTIGGMTCSSCAARIERKLNRLDGVTATVNLATETAAVDFDPDKTDPHTLVATVEATGYTATLPRPPKVPDPTTPRRSRHRPMGPTNCAEEY